MARSPGNPDYYTYEEAVGNRTPDAISNERGQFLVKVYGHLAVAMVAFVLIEILIFTTPALLEPILTMFVKLPWLVFLGAFMVVGWIASQVAAKSDSKPLHYLALAGYVVAEAIIFVPLLALAHVTVGGGVIGSAGLVTLLGFGGLTAIVFITRKDFSFLRGILMFGGLLAIIGIVASVIFGFTLGTWFSVAMIGLAGGMILYDTSNILHHYPGDRYVAGALALFASVALLFWYVLQLFIAMRR